MLFLICSTNYIPNKLIHNFEKKYPVFNEISIDLEQHYYIHILASGYKLDVKLPAIAQLETPTLSRLSEGIRVYRLLPKKTILTSGAASKDLESQASVARRAAVELGVLPEQIQLLDTPTTTKKEVLAFQDKVGKDVNIILVTDALHMPRAMKIYEAYGYSPIAAPTNFRVKYARNSYNGITLPSFSSLQHMEIWFREFLATLKFNLLEK